MPDFTIQGNPDGILSRVATMHTEAANFEAVATALIALNTDGWSGRAADRFREKFHTEPSRWTDAAVGFHRAANGLNWYAQALRSAQSEARRAKAEYEHGEQITREARQAYDADVARAQDEVAWTNIRGSQNFANWQPVSLTIMPFVDPGEAIRHNALRMLESTKSTVVQAAHECAREVRAGCATAPEQRNWFESGLAFVGGIIVGAGEAVWDLVEMGFSLQYGPLLDMIDLASGELTPEELAAKNQMKVEQVEAVLKSLKEDPIEFGKQMGKSMLDWDTWADDPARAIGHLVPDAIATVATGGAGASVKALRGLKALHEVSLLERPMHGLKALRGMELYELAGISKLDDAALARHIDALDVNDQARLLRRGGDMTPQSLESNFNPRYHDERYDLERVFDTYANEKPDHRGAHPVQDGPLVNVHSEVDKGSGAYWTDPAEILKAGNEKAAMERLALKPEWYVKATDDGAHLFEHRDEITVRQFSTTEDMRMDVGHIGAQERRTSEGSFDGMTFDATLPGGAKQYVSGLDDGSWTSPVDTWTGPAPWVQGVPDGVWGGFGAGAATGAAGSAVAGAAADQ